MAGAAVDRPGQPQQSTDHPEDERMRKILVIDDDPLNLIFLEDFLSSCGHQPLLAENGSKGLSMFRQERPDLVLTDIMMPVMDGYETTRRIRRDPTTDTSHVPVIFLTGMEDSVGLARCLECGGDDFLTKPLDPVILAARVNAWIKRIELSEQLAYDRQLMERSLAKMRQDPRFHPYNLRLLLTPVEKTAGDLVLSCRPAPQCQYVFIGDFTGHGLSAAIGGPMVSDIFYAMSEKHLPLDQILREINRKVHQKLPTGVFLAAAAFHWDRRRDDTVQVYNCGMPPVVLFRQSAPVNRFLSSHSPLGMFAEESLSGSAFPCQPLRDDRLIACSDGLAETQDPEGTPLEQEGVESLLGDLLRRNAPIEEVLTSLSRFHNSAAFEDDITLVEIHWT
ncbi:MAG: fused response regulator/phosphatase [Magnetococcus sp. WYHC-3]